MQSASYQIIKGAAMAVALAGSITAQNQSMIDGENGFTATPIFTVGESFDGYFPVGILDGIGAYRRDADTVRAFANHELLHFRGIPYQVANGTTLSGARVSYFDIDVSTRQVVASGLAYREIIDANGNVVTDLSFQPVNLQGFSRFCSSALFPANEFGFFPGRNLGFFPTRGVEDTIYITGEEDGGNFNAVGGGYWALDVESGKFYQVPAFGRGAWEGLAQLDTGNRRTVAFLLSDDSSPFDADGDGEGEASPMYLYVGTKDPRGGFLARNGLSGGSLYVWVADSGAKTPADFNTSGTLQGTWVEVDNSQDASLASNDGSTGRDNFGYPTQRSLWTQAEAVGAFGFSRPEDVSTNPLDGTEAVLASTGVDTYVIGPVTGNGADTFGTVYVFKTNFRNLTATCSIVYDGDADTTRALRSPDNLDWADDGYIYVQEDEAEEDTASGDEVLFNNRGESLAANPNEASIVRLSPLDGSILRVGQINRSVILDPTTNGTPFDTDDGRGGEWESSGILDVSGLFGDAPGTTFLVDVQAHGIEDQTDVNPDSRINDFDLREGGQLLFLTRDAGIPGDVNGDGRVNFRDLFAVIRSYGPCGADCPADLNRDGVVDFRDALIVLANLGRRGS